MELLEYNFSVQEYNSNEYLQTNCIDFAVFNAGDGVIVVNNFPIAPGQSFGLNGNVNEVLKQNLLLTFQQPATIFKAVYVRRFYVGQNF